MMRASFAVLSLVLLLAGSTGTARSSVSQSALVVGDSLTVGVENRLPAYLRGWNLRIDERVGRPTAEAARIVGHVPRLPERVGFLLGTNDDPDGRALLRELHLLLQRLPARGCLVTATIARPPVDGAGYARVNASLRKLARDDARLRVVDWARMTERHPGWLVADSLHVHPTDAGYHARAQAIAAALRTCS